MTYPYSSLYLEAYQARQRLTQTLRDQGFESIGGREGKSVTNEWKAGAHQPRLSSRVTGARDAILDLRNDTTCERNSTGRDMSTSTFALMLLLFGTIVAAYTDQSAFWLLIGPVPLALGLAGIAFFRPDVRKAETDRYRYTLPCNHRTERLRQGSECQLKHSPDHR